MQGRIQPVRLEGGRFQ